jgi:tRNA pseudouridine38-40 synthase
MRIALGVEYDGSPFFGWQSQTDGRTVQDTLQRALGQIAGDQIASDKIEGDQNIGDQEAAGTVSVIAAGRTDTGVHALEQVVHFDTLAERPLSAWVRGVNALLPDSIAVRWAHPVPDEFHARFSAHGRSYRYLLVNRAVRPAIQAGKVGWYHAPLDLAAMHAAAQSLLGEHDFSAFRSVQCQARSPVKHLQRLDIRRQGEMLIFDLSANAFLHHMVRNIVGCLVYVGKGKYPPEWLAEVLNGRERSLAAPTFSPDGLYLRRITYDEKWGLPQLAEESECFPGGQPDSPNRSP